MNKKLDLLLNEREDIALEIKKLQKRRKAISSHISVLRFRNKPNYVI